MKLNSPIHQADANTLLKIRRPWVINGEIPEKRSRRLRLAWGGSSRRAGRAARRNKWKRHGGEGMCKNNHQESRYRRLTIKTSTLKQHLQKTLSSRGSVLRRRNNQDRQDRKRFAEMQKLVKKLKYQDVLDFINGDLIQLPSRKKIV